MVELFREFYWLIFPVLGMGIAFMAVAGEFSRQKKALDVLRTYVEKGVEPPQNVLAVLSRASSDEQKHPMGSSAFFFVLAVGFAAIAWWLNNELHVWPFTLGFGVAALVMMALAVSNFVAAMSKTSSANGA